MTDGICVMHDSSSGMRKLCLDDQVVATAVTLARDLYAEDAHTRYTNDQMRHAAYKQYVYGLVGRTGAGNRVVVPACVVSYAHWVYCVSPFANYIHALFHTE